jgi:hypothetical protein
LSPARRVSWLDVDRRTRDYSFHDYMRIVAHARHIFRKVQRITASFSCSACGIVAPRVGGPRACRPLDVSAWLEGEPGLLDERVGRSYADRRLLDCLRYRLQASSTSRSRERSSFTRVSAVAWRLLSGTNRESKPDSSASLAENSRLVRNTSNASQRSLRERGPFDGEADARRLPDDARLLRDCFNRSDDTARDKSLPSLVLAREHENRVACGDMPAAYIVFCAVNEKVFALRSETSALTANATMLVLSRPERISRSRQPA